MNEADINRRIAQWLYTMPTVMGYHHPDSRRATLAGFPDWVFIGPGGILFREIKGTNDAVTPDQRRVGRMINYTGNWQVWGPKDIANGIAERELQDIASAPDAIGSLRGIQIGHGNKQINVF